MKKLVFFLEEYSAAEMLKGILSKFLPDNIIPDFKVFEGKQDMERRLSGILRAWRTPDCMFIVMRDQDSGDCRIIKSKLINLCQQAGHRHAIVRIACRELESFYLGDLAAVEKGLGLLHLSAKQNSRKFRAPDSLGNPSEELFRLTGNIYQKVNGSRAIAPYMNLKGNRSHSFSILVSSIRRIVGTTSKLI